MVAVCCVRSVCNAMSRPSISYVVDRARTKLDSNMRGDDRIGGLVVSGKEMARVERCSHLLPWGPKARVEKIWACLFEKSLKSPD